MITAALAIAVTIASAGQTVLTSALTAGLNDPTARIEVVDTSSGALSAGELVFARNGLAVPAVVGADTVLFWRGSMRMDAHRTLPVWARVKINAEREVVRAAENLPAGTTIRESHFVVERAEVSPLAKPAAPVDAIVGSATRRSIRKGEVITEQLLAAPFAVERGAPIRVLALEGPVKLSFDAIAERAARTGDAVLLRNPVNGARFRAVVASDGTAVVGRRIEAQP